MKEFLMTLVGIGVISVIIFTFVSGGTDGTVDTELNDIGTEMITELETISTP